LGDVYQSHVLLTVFCLLKVFYFPVLLEEPASLFGIAVAHTIFNILCTILMLPLSGFLERLVNRLVPDGEQPETQSELDERLLSTPAIALERCHKVAVHMAKTAVSALKESIAYLYHASPELAASIREKEEKTDYYEDILGTYLVKLSAKQISGADSAEAAKLLKMIGDFERISDHAVNILKSAEEMQGKGLAFTADAVSELQIIGSAVNEILDLSLTAFLSDDLKAASMVEPLEQVIDQLKEQMRTRHILRMQQGLCSIDVGFIWSDLLTSLERTSDHCSNIGGCVIDMAQHNMNIHESLRSIRDDSEDFQQKFRAYAGKYSFVRSQAF
ncbi:MAG: Na/Pi cotransporter family protein, partial [Lachnospiraceae bacterium]|nr:Na/Pi cotransporter family protein [Lachnospiraceae bacterium]